MLFCWSQATDDVRDLCRHARETLGLNESHAVNFRLLKTPSAWNTIGIKGVIGFYNQMTDDQKVTYIENNQHLWEYIEPDE